MKYILESIDATPVTYVRSVDCYPYLLTTVKRLAQRFPTEAAAIVAAEDADEGDWCPEAVRA